MTIPDSDTIPPIFGSLGQLAPHEWFKDRERSSFWLRLTTLAGARPADVIAKLHALKLELKLDAPLALSFGTLRDAKLPKTTFVTFAAESGQTTILTKLDTLELPAAHYWFLTTPLMIDGVRGSEYKARQLLARASALVVGHCGLNTMVDVVFEGEVDVASSRWHSTSPVLRTVSPVDGPILSEHLWESIGEIGAALTTTPIERRQRIELALEFLDRATRSEEEFFNYWTALEILCNGKAQTIRSKLQGAYELASVGEVDRQSGFKQIAKWRHDFFHKGRRPTISADVARYIQFLFLDLLRHELGLECRRYLGMIQGSEGFDLSPIGLSDRRTPAQREGVRRARELLQSQATNPQAGA